MKKSFLKANCRTSVFIIGSNDTNTALVVAQIADGASTALGFNKTEVALNSEIIPCSSGKTGPCDSLCCSADETYREVVKNCDSFAFVPDLMKGCVNDLQRICIESVSKGAEQLAGMGMGSCECDSEMCDLDQYSAEDGPSLDDMLMKLICRLHQELKNYPQTCDKYSGSGVEVSISFLFLLATLVF